MIIHSWVDLEIGQIYPKDKRGWLTDAEGNRNYDIKFKVLRLSNREEYLKGGKEDGITFPPIPSPGYKYYEISMD